jgi:hypothetical protein
MRRLMSLSNRANFESHISLLISNLETYTTLQRQRSITTTLQEHQANFDPVTAYPVIPPPITAIPLPPAHFNPPRTPEQGRFPFYAVRRGRTTGIFDNWTHCHRSIHRTANEYSGLQTVQTIDEAIEYINQTPHSY